tara:strand:- start:379 stop:543 length:165 start_codon:yes stop_codon:yes gene_type:complete
MIVTPHSAPSPAPPGRTNTAPPGLHNPHDLAQCACMYPWLAKHAAWDAHAGHFS